MTATAATPRSAGLRLPAWPVEAWTGLLAGVAAPLTAAALYHTYRLSLPSPSVEITRQLGLPYVVVELALVMYARGQGFDAAAVFRGLGLWTRRALAVFLATFWISSVFVAHAAAFSSALCLILVLHLYTVAAAFHLSRQSWWEPGRLAGGLALGLLAMLPVVVVHLGWPPVGAGPSTWIGGAPIPGFISNRLFGAWCAVALALLVGIAWRGSADRPVPGWLYPAIALGAALVVWSGTRAAILAEIVAMIVGAWLTRGRAAPGFWRRTVLAVAIGSVLGPLLIPETDPLFVLFRFNAAPSVDAVTTGRIELWTKTLHVAVQRPLLGHGMGSNWWLVSLSGVFHVQPHNAIVQFLVNWGAIPAALALFLLAVTVRRLHAVAKRTPRTVPLVMAIDCLLTMSMFDGMMHFTEFLMLFAILTGVALSPVLPDAREGVPAAA